MKVFAFTGGGHAVGEKKQKTAEVGEVCIAAPQVMVGYWGHPEETAAMIRNGWVYTGDLGYMDEDGYLFIVDRKKEVIIRGGENIACAEVERAFYAHPEVSEVAVFGQGDERFGEVPVAVYCLKPGAALDEAAVREHLAAHLAPFKLPVRMWREQGPLPRLGSEKIDKRALRERYRASGEAVTAGP